MKPVPALPRGAPYFLNLYVNGSLGTACLDRESADFWARTNGSRRVALIKVKPKRKKR